MNSESALPAVIKFSGEWLNVEVIDEGDGAAASSEGAAWKDISTDGYGFATVNLKWCPRAYLAAKLSLRLAGQPESEKTIFAPIVHGWIIEAGKEIEPAAIMIRIADQFPDNANGGIQIRPGDIQIRPVEGYTRLNDQPQALPLRLCKKHPELCSANP
jgi:hypothetical protein